MIAALAAAGCLPEERSIAARQLYRGRNITALRFATVHGRSYVSFDVRKRMRTPTEGGLLEWRLAAFDDGSPIVVIPDRSDAWGIASQDLNPPADPSQQYASALETADRIYYAMRDERPADPVAGIPRTATLTIFTVDGGIREEIPFVESFAIGDRPGVFFYRRPAPGQPASDLVLRDDLGRQRVLDNVTGQVTFFGATGLMFVGGADRTLYRMRSIDAPIKPLRSGVSRWIPVDGARMLLGVADQGKPATTLFTVASRRERRLPGDAICCLLGGIAGRYLYAEAATPSRDVPARLHFYDLDRGDDMVLPLPPELVDVVDLTIRPGTQTAMLRDSGGRLAMLDFGAAPPTVRYLPLAAIRPTFTRDGTRLIYLAPETTVPQPEGRLMSTDLASSTIPLSPAGALVQDDSFFEIGDDQTQRIVFWARYGRTVSDLYFVPPAGGEAVIVAEQIRDVSVGLSGLIGIINASLQDLTGDLVRKNLETGEVHVYSQAVESYAVDGDRLAFFVWNRVPAGPDGVWAVTSTP